MPILDPQRFAVRRALIISTAGSAALVSTLPTMAQDAGPPVDEVVVTGTRIRTPGLTSNSPIMTITADDLARQQPAAIEEYLRKLPGVVPAIGNAVNNGANGSATIDLRGLGPNRNLVLVNGRRLVPFSLDGETNTNVIPVALIERVDVLTGGASAVYGADAVSGVANFVLRNNFEGIDLSMNVGSASGDADRVNTNLTLGSAVADGRGNVALSIGYTEVDPLNQDRRPYGERALSSTTGLPQGSPTAVPLIINNVLPGFQINPGTGTFVPQYQDYNFNPDNYYQTGLNRYQITALGEFEINERATVYSDLLFTRSSVVSSAASSGSFFNNFTMPIGNPFLPDAARAQLCAAVTPTPIPAANCVAGSTTPITLSLGRRFTEYGPRLTDNKNTMFQYTVGVTGDIGRTWNYDAYFSRGEADNTRTRVNWGSLSKLTQALNATNVNTCTNTANGCVPFNIFGPEGSITPAMLGFVGLDSFKQDFVTQEVLAASVSGDLGDISIPWADSPIGVAVGIEDRRLDAKNKSDSAGQIQGEVLGSGAPVPDRSGFFTLKELYGEMLIPVVTDRTLARTLTFEVGYRKTEFETASTSEDYDSFKYGLEWAPIESLRFRGMFQRATRSPNVNELFAPLVASLSNLAVDPCQLTLINPAEANTAGTLSNLCRLTGVPVASIGALPAPAAGQINVRTGGNSALGPEEADTTTVGFVFSPSFVDDLTITLDFYDIKVEKAVSNPTATDVLDDCYNATRNPSLALNAACGQVLRDPTTGTFNGAQAPGVVLPKSNFGYYETDGIDLGVSYGYSFDNARFGQLIVTANVNKLDSFKFQATPSAIVRECAGFYSVACDTAASQDVGVGPRPDFQLMQSTTWAFGNFDVGYTWRRIAEMIEEPLGASFLPAYSAIPDADYLDLSGGWDFRENYRLTVTVLNATDEAPHLVGATIGSTTSNNGNTYPSIYDAIGRYTTVGVSVRF